MIGTVGDARKTSLPAKLTSLTHDEQYSYMSMWALMTSPLFFSGDMTKLDAFTLNVLDNSEVIDIDQDSLGQQAKVTRHTPTEFVLARKLDDGSIAIGLFNLATTAAKISVDWHDLNLNGKMIVRDVWRQHNLGSANHNIAASVPAHGVSLLRLTSRNLATHGNRKGPTSVGPQPPAPEAIHSALPRVLP
jgi:alpha-galactosidase